jgi:hypothetical protein
MHTTNRRTKSNTESNHTATKSNHTATKSNKNQTSKQEDLVILVWDLDLAVKNRAATMALCAGPAAGQGLVSFLAKVNTIQHFAPWGRLDPLQAS